MRIEEYVLAYRGYIAQYLVAVTQLYTITPAYFHVYIYPVVLGLFFNL